jgi:hypothetical protein
MDQPDGQDARRSQGREIGTAMVWRNGRISRMGVSSDRRLSNSWQSPAHAGSWTGERARRRMPVQA